MNGFQKAYRRVLYTQVLLAVIVVALTVYVLVAVHGTNVALCKFRGDLQQRVDATQDFLDTHPGPKPFPGVPRASLERSLAGQRATIKSLSNLNC